MKYTTKVTDEQEKLRFIICTLFVITPIPNSELIDLWETKTTYRRLRLVRYYKAIMERSRSLDQSVIENLYNTLYRWDYEIKTEHGYEKLKSTIAELAYYHHQLERYEVTVRYYKHQTQNINDVTFELRGLLRAKRFKPPKTWGSGFKLTEIFPIRKK